MPDDVAKVMRANPLISTVHDDWLEPVPSLKLDIDQDRARAIGVTSQAVRQTLQAVLSGVTDRRVPRGRGNDLRGCYATRPGRAALERGRKRLCEDCARRCRAIDAGRQDQSRAGAWDRMAAFTSADDHGARHRARRCPVAGCDESDLFPDFSLCARRCRSATGSRCRAPSRSRRPAKRPSTPRCRSCCSPSCCCS